MLTVGAVGVAHAQTASASNAPLPYSYPFADPVFAQKLASNPMVVELYTSLDCLFCPRAEALMADLVTQTKVIGLACYTDEESDAYPLARSFCSDRQDAYSARLTDGLLYTPQIVINGHIDAVGHQFDDVSAGVKEALNDQVVYLTPRPSSEQNVYLFDLPKMAIKGPADIALLTYRAPYSVPKNMRQSQTHPNPLVHVVDGHTPLGSWDGRAKTISVSFTPHDDTVGFMVLVSGNDGGIVAAAQVEP